MDECQSIARHSSDSRLVMRHVTHVLDDCYDNDSDPGDMEDYSTGYQERQVAGERHSRDGRNGELTLSLGLSEIPGQRDAEGSGQDWTSETDLSFDTHDDSGDAQEGGGVGAWDVDDGCPQTGTGSSTEQRRGGGRNRTGGGGGKGRPMKSASVGNMRTIIQCTVCNKTFNNSSALAKHKLIHSDERKYTCLICSKAFKRQDHLNGHMMTHCAKKPYECKYAGCDKSYCDARSLRRHLENHHQQLIDAASASSISCDTSLTPSLTPGGVSTTGGNVFVFEHAYGGLGENSISVSSGIGAELHEMSPISPAIGCSASPTDGGMRMTWPHGYNPLDEPKPVKCTVCERRFRNLPALNGHMRLHGGYMKKDLADQNMVEELDESKPTITESTTEDIESTSSLNPPNYSAHQLIIQDIKLETNDSRSSSRDRNNSNRNNSQTASEFLSSLATSPCKRKNRSNNTRASFEQQQLVSQAQLDDQKLADKTQHLKLGDSSNDDTQYNVHRQDYMLDQNQQQALRQDWRMEEKVVGGVNANTSCFMIDEQQHHQPSVNSAASRGFQTDDLTQLTLLEHSDTFNNQDLSGIYCGNVGGVVGGNRTVNKTMHGLSPYCPQMDDSSCDQNVLSMQKMIVSGNDVHFNSVFNNCSGGSSSTRTPGISGALPSYGNALLNSPGLAASAPATPSHGLPLGQCRASQKFPKCTTPSYSSLHNQVVSAGLPPHSPYPAQQAYSNSTSNQNTPCGPGTSQSRTEYFQFPSRAPLSSCEGPRTPSYSVRTPHSPFTPRQLKHPHTPGTPSSAHHFQFPPVAGTGTGQSETYNCDSPFVTSSHSHTKYHPYSQSQPLMSPRYAQQQLQSQQLLQQQQKLESSEKFQRDVQQMEQVLEQRIQELQQQDLQQQRQQMILRTSEDQSALQQDIKPQILIPAQCGGSAGAQLQLDHRHRDSTSGLMGRCTGADGISESLSQQMQQTADMYSANSGGTADVISLSQFDMDLDTKQDDVIHLLLSGKLNDENVDLDLTTPHRSDIIDVDVQAEYLLGDVGAFTASATMTQPKCDDLSLLLGHTIKLEPQSSLQTSGGSYNINSSMDMFYGGPTHVSGIVNDVVGVSGNNCAGASQPLSAKKKRRPDPLVIPTNVNNYLGGGPVSGLGSLAAGNNPHRSPHQKTFDGSVVGVGGRRGRTPPPYIPQMMSQVDRNDSSLGVFWAASDNSSITGAGSFYRVPPQSAPPYQMSGCQTTQYSFDSNSTDRLQNASVGPHGGVGLSQYQADMLPLCENRCDESHDDRVDAWNRQVSVQRNDKEFIGYDEFEGFASLAPDSGGSSREHALHLVTMHNGTTKMLH